MPTQSFSEKLALRYPVAFYAMGSGLGHLSRIYAFIHTFQLHMDKCVIITNSLFTYQVFPQKTKKIIFPVSVDSEPQTIQKQLHYLLGSEKIKSVFLDVFPRGICGEWNGFSKRDIDFYYLGRLLKWTNYLEYATASQPFGMFKKAFFFEKTEPLHYQFICSDSQEITPIISLKYPAPSASCNYSLLLPNEFLLVAHSGPVQEVQLLIEHAYDIAKAEKLNARIVVFTQVARELLPENIIVKYIYPVFPLFPAAKKIVTACGFNTMEQTNQYRHKHVFIPFERRFDHQFLRAQRAREKIN